MMSRLHSSNVIHEGRLRAVLYLLLIACGVSISSCAGNTPPNPAGPRAGDAPYPILLADDDNARREAALAAWANFTRAQGITNAPAPELQPVTATLRSIPTFAGTALYLPEIGEDVPMTDEETNEALRRFIASAGALLCPDTQQLSLVQRVNGADGVKQARYEQRPFRYSLRNGYGELLISFTPDRRIVQISSTCVPDIERIRRGFIGLAQQRLSADKVLENLEGRAVSYKDAGGNQQTLTLPAKDKIHIRELIIYPIAREAEPSLLEFHVAWEARTDDAPDVAIYLDSITGDIIGAEQRQQS